VLIRDAEITNIPPDNKPGREARAPRTIAEAKVDTDHRRHKKGHAADVLHGSFMNHPKLY